MKLKENVKCLGIKPELLLAVIIAESVFRTYEVEFVITSIADGKHQATNSKHYSGNAFDVRIKNIPTKETLDYIIHSLKSNLTKDYRVILESDHIHIDYNPVYII